MDAALNVSAPADQLANVRKIAMDRCDSMIDWYEIHKKKCHNQMSASRLMAISLSGLVPVLVIIQISLRSETLFWLIVSILIALFPASAAIVSAMDEVFQFKDNWIRYSEASEELKSERVKFLTRMTNDYDLKLTDYQALSNFVTNVELIATKERQNWREVAARSPELEQLIKSIRQDGKGS